MQAHLQAYFNETDEDGKKDDIELHPRHHHRLPIGGTPTHSASRSRRPSNVSQATASRSRRLSNVSQVSSHSRSSGHLAGHSLSRHGSKQGSKEATRRNSHVSIASIAEAVAQVEEKAEEIAVQRVKDFGLARGSLMNMIGPKEIKFLHRSYKVNSFGISLHCTCPSLYCNHFSLSIYLFFCCVA